MGTRSKKETIRKPTEFDIQRILTNKYANGAKYILTNLYVFRWESDFLIKTQAGYWYEFEIKRTLADFKNDAKNKIEKFKTLCAGFENNRPNYFSYCVTEDIVEKVLHLIPDYAGLYYVNSNGRLVNVKSPIRLHNDKIPDNELNLTDKFYYNMQTYKNKYDNHHKEIEKLRGEINFLKTEFKAATGYDIKEVY